MFSQILQRSSRIFPLLGINAHKMSSNHLTRTENNFRQNVISEACVTDVTQLSPLVKGITLQVIDLNFSFWAGQWVDVFIPGINQVGGFSMCSAPTSLKRFSNLQLAVKLSNSAPAKWIHNQCKIGDRLHLRVGGDMYLKIPQTKEQMPDILLVAGGVGINPLWSMLLELKEQEILFSQKSLPKKVTLLYSSASVEELLFKDDLIKLKEDLSSCFNFKIFVTQQDPGIHNRVLKQNFFNSLQRGRIQAEDIESCLSNCDKSHLLCFLCGPSGMLDDCRKILGDLGVPGDSIKFEKWW